MSSSNRRAASSFTEDELNDLIFKLQTLLPSNSTSRRNTRASSSTILKETCKYIKKLHKEVDDLSEKLSQLLASGEITNDDADAIMRLFMQ